jgi:hypothetical protein
MAEKVRLTKEKYEEMKKKGWRIVRNTFTKKQYFYKFDKDDKLIAMEGDAIWKEDYETKTNTR